jgi:hypothetical protein
LNHLPQNHPAIKRATPIDGVSHGRQSATYQPPEGAASTYYRRYEPMAIQSFRALIEGLYESEGFKKAFLTVFVADYGIKVESSKNMLTISFSRTGAVNVKIAETDEKKLGCLGCRS